MKTITQVTTHIITLGLLSVLLSACSNDNKGSFDTGESGIVPTSVDINITACSAFVQIRTNDLLVKDNDATTVQIQHDINGTRSVCVSTGSAHLVRGL